MNVEQAAISPSPDPPGVGTTVLDYQERDVLDAPVKSRVFRMSEIRRVGTAATMIVVCGTVIIIGIMLMMFGHYSSLSHAGPKAVLDGAVIALLMGQHGRWRCLALLGLVYGLVLLLQVGVFYLVVVMAAAGLVAAITGRLLDPLGRATAVLVAAVIYELLAGSGGAIRIYFGTGNQAGAILWWMWLAELPLRAIGALIGVVWARRWMSRTDSVALEKVAPIEDGPRVALGPAPVRKWARGNLAVGIRVVASIVACVLPMMLEKYSALAAVALWYVLYALAAGMRKKILGVMVALFWGWLIFGVGSYLWHRDMLLVKDLFRTFVLRFVPLTLASMVLISTVRPVDLIRWLRTMRFSGIVILPLAQVARTVPRFRTLIRRNTARGTRMRPRTFINEILKPMVRQWSHELHCADRAE